MKTINKFTDRLREKGIIIDVKLGSCDVKNLTKKILLETLSEFNKLVPQVIEDDFYADAEEANDYFGSSDFESGYYICHSKGILTH